MATDHGAAEATATERAVVDIERQHSRYLLNDIRFGQQFSHLYFARLGELKSRAAANSFAILDQENAAGSVPSVTRQDVVRVLGLEPNKRQVVVGMLYKQMVQAPNFINEYNKGLIQMVDADDDDEDAGGEEAGEAEVPAVDEGGFGSAMEAGETKLLGEGNPDDGDVLILEDESGRVELRGNIDKNVLVTGIIITVVGVLKEKGVFTVERWFPAGYAPQPQKRLLPQNARPRYVALVSGLNIADAGDQQLRGAIESMTEFLSGMFGNIEQAAAIGHLVLAGNVIGTADEIALKYKTKLDPADYRLVATTGMHASGGSAAAAAASGTSGVDTSTTAVQMMSTADAVLSEVAKTISIDIMAGENDLTNCFLPQQPLHPVTLRKTTRLSTSRVVSNPYQFAVDNGTVFYGTSGQNVSDYLRLTAGLQPLDVMEAQLSMAHCACTAPDTLPCYPYLKTDPFVFESTPHVYFAGNQRTFGTKLVTFDGAGGLVGAASAQNGSARLVCVPSFSHSHSIVLVDIDSSTMEAYEVTFGR